MLTLRMGEKQRPYAGHRQRELRHRYAR